MKCKDRRALQNADCGRVFLAGRGGCGDGFVGGLEGWVGGRVVYFALGWVGGRERRVLREGFFGYLIVSAG